MIVRYRISCVELQQASGSCTVTYASDLGYYCYILLYYLLLLADYGTSVGVVVLVYYDALHCSSLRNIF